MPSGPSAKPVFSSCVYRSSSWELELGDLSFYSLLGATAITAFVSQRGRVEMWRSPRVSLGVLPVLRGPPVGVLQADLWVDGWRLSRAPRWQGPVLDLGRTSPPSSGRRPPGPSPLLQEEGRTGLHGWFPHGVPRNNEMPVAVVLSLPGAAGGCVACRRESAEPFISEPEFQDADSVPRGDGARVAGRVTRTEESDAARRADT